MRSYIKGVMLAVMCLAVYSCAAFNLVTPQTFKQRLAYAYSTNTSVRNIAKDMLLSGTIKVDDAKMVEQKTDESRALLDTAQDFSFKGDISTAEGKLLAAQSILTVLQSFLRSRGGEL